MHLTHKEGELSARPLKFLETDTLVVRWIAQAAVNVELFTIPLYMTSLYSITGMHPITSQGNSFYKGRQWPGAKTSAFTDYKPGKKGWGNKKAFNIVFSVFIQEMLHLQMAANLATSIGAVPSFTATALQSGDHGWTCFGPKLTAIPGIVDLTDTNRFKDVKVNVGPLDEERIKLFLAIEQPQETAEQDIVRNKDRYFPKVPFKYDTVTELDAKIMFGSIGYMYQCYRDYLLIRYEDGTRLWDHVMNPGGQQNDLFNNFSFPGHPMREFMGFETTIALTDPEIALRQALNMMNAITDQGEGATLGARYDEEGHRLNDGKAKLVQGDVNPSYCPNRDALASDYPSYSMEGKLVPSADAAARSDNDGVDHYTRFREIEDIRGSGGLETWDQSPKIGKWAASDLTTEGYDPNDNPYGLPAPEAIANALNALKNGGDAAANFQKMSQAVCGAIKGVTTVLDDYWNPVGAAVSFPFPSMAGSGDRMSTAWAVFGATPDLSVGVGEPDKYIVNHACQGLDVEETGGKWGANSCAETSIYHTCRGSNLCKGQGGCGFVQLTSGGGSCGGASSGCGAASSKTSNAPKASPVASGSCGTPTTIKGGGCSAVTLRSFGGLCGTPTPSPTPTPSGPMYTAPSDNICGGFGGCAVPISAMQLYPKAGTMEVWALVGSSKPVLCGTPKPTPSPSGCGAPKANADKNLCGTPSPSPTPSPSGCGAPSSKKIATIDFKEGDKVEDIAFQAFAKVVAFKVNGDPDKPVEGLVQQAPNDLRLAYPPST
ncbi:ferritin-like domain-containing protein [Sphingomonas sp. Sphisp140]|uniref:ferritin-like domain-containing protein n=1 Tax=unclassified Sphingomonas TaxID=196159 RepID=UPI0039AEB21F